MSEKFLRHTGPALVFDDYPSLKKMLDDEHADVTEDHVIVLRNAGPKGGPGMPEWGMTPVPQKLIRQGVRDMLRMKIGGASLAEDLRHIDSVLSILQDGQRLCVDANGRFDLDTAIAYAKALSQYDLFWYEEAGD
jgi:hypothetical protein